MFADRPQMKIITKTIIIINLTCEENENQVSHKTVVGFHFGSVHKLPFLGYLLLLAIGYFPIL